MQVTAIVGDSNLATVPLFLLEILDRLGGLIISDLD